MIRPAAPDDLPHVERLLGEVVREGTTYVYEDTAAAVEWMRPPAEVWLAQEGENVLGAYCLRPNQPGRGKHVANAAYLVAESARGKGLGRRLAEHSLGRAKERGFLAMQFNFVVSTNPAVRLWESLGFRIVGRLPQAFAHPQHGLVDAFVMHRLLD